MDIDVQPLSGATCVSIDGRIDAYTVNRVEEELNSLIRIGSSNLICDLSGVEFVSSSGFKAFRRIISFAREQEGDLKFCGLNPEVTRLFSAIGFSREADVFSSREEALSDFGRPKTDAEKGQTRNTPADPALESGFDLKAKFSGLSSEVTRLLHSVGLSRETGPSSSREKTPSNFSFGSRKRDASMRPPKKTPKDSSLKKTVIFSSSGPPSSDEEGSTSTQASPRTSEDEESSGRFALLEPVKVTLYPEPSHFQNLSRLLGTIGSLVGFSSMELVKLNVAVIELCRSVVKELGPDETFTIEIDSLSPGFRVYLDIPRKNFNIYGNLHPNTSDKTLSEQEGKTWLLNYVDEVDFSPSKEGTRYLLSLYD